MITTSRVVRAKDFQEAWFKTRTVELAEGHQLHRKLWEFCVVAQIYADRIGQGGSLLGFGVGREPLAAWFANRMANVIATDRPDETDQWTVTGQHARSLADLNNKLVCSPERFAEYVRFLPLDMNNLTPTIRAGKFNMTWSCGSFEHIGSIEHGLSFFCKQMECLEPGGLAVHTTEFNREGGPTLEAHDIVLFQEQHLRELEARLAAQGDKLWPLDLEPGQEEADLHVDKAPYGLPHLSLTFGGFTTTSVLLVAQRGRR